MGRATQGVRLINLSKDDSIADVAVMNVEDEDTPEEGLENAETADGEATPNAENTEDKGEDSTENAADGENDTES